MSERLADVRLIDQLIESVVGAVATTASTLPIKPDIHAIARERGLGVQRGDRDDTPDGTIIVPQYYSDRELRVAAARHIAEDVVRNARQQCDKVDPTQCLSSEVCRLLDDESQEEDVLNQIAAAMLMPTADVSIWGEKLRWQVIPLANSYEVPLDLARQRLDAVQSAMPSE